MLQINIFGQLKIQKIFFHLCDDQIISVPSDMGYTAPVDNLVHRVHQVPALHLFITQMVLL